MDGHKGSGLENEQNLFTGGTRFRAGGRREGEMAILDTRHMLAEIDPAPDQVTVAIGSTQYDMTPLITMDDNEIEPPTSKTMFGTAWRRRPTR
jgi:hypothetical protein